MRKLFAALCAVLIIACVMVLCAAGYAPASAADAASGSDLPPAAEPTTPPADVPVVPSSPSDIPTTPVPETPSQPAETPVHGTPIIIPDPDRVIDYSQFEGKTLDEVFAEFFEKRGIDPDTLAFGYRNTVTGEEYYHNGDKYMLAASVYKVPLNMYYSEQVYLGEIDWDTQYGGIRYELIQRSSIESSNNELSEMLQTKIGDGSYRDYREAIAGYLGVNTHTVEERYFKYNEFTPRQIISALGQLYEEPERFPRVIDYMKLGAPNNYFTYSEHRYEVAHKYGFIEYDGHYILNDAAIVFSEDPILLVMFTDNCAGYVNTMTAYCTLMCDYTLYQRHLRETATEPTPTPVPASPSDIPGETSPASPSDIPEPTAEPSPAPTPVPTPAPTEPIVGAPEKSASPWVIVIMALVACVLIALCLILGRRSRIAAIVITVIVALALIASVVIRVLPQKETSGEPTKPAPAPAVTAAPEVMEPAEDVPQITEYTLSGESAGDILALAQHKGLEWVDANGSQEYAALAQLQRELPDCEVRYELEVHGVTVSSLDTELTLDDWSITDNAELLEKLPLLPRLERVDIRELPLENAQVEALMAACPDIDFDWTVVVGDFRVSSEALCFSTRQVRSPAHRFTSEELEPILRYCTELVALDLSHNDLEDISLIGEMKNLKVLLLGDNSDIANLSPLASLTELEYLELYSIKAAEDFSVLKELTKLKEVNLSYSPAAWGADFIDSLPLLERAWLRGAGVPAAEWNSLIADYPQIKFHFFHEAGAATAGGWNASERNLSIRRAFTNWEYVVAYESCDSITYRHEYNLDPVYPSYS